MPFVIYQPKGEPIHLGNEFDVLHIFQTLGQLEPGDGYAELHYLVNTSGETISTAFFKKVSEQASLLLELRGRDLTSEAKELLQKLARGGTE